MPMWLWFFIAVFSFWTVISFVMSPPEAVAKWFFGKFRLHPQLRDANVEVSIDDKYLSGEAKTKVIDDFNQATFLQRYDVIPSHSGTPLVIDTKQGKTDVHFLVYSYRDHVDVFKHYKKKVVAYRLLSRNLQQPSVSSILSPSSASRLPDDN